MSSCKACFAIINDAERVEILVHNPLYNPKIILGRYMWCYSDYCFSCIEIAKKINWNSYVSLIEELRYNPNLKDILYKPIPTKITINLSLFGLPIFGLYYQGKMHSSKLDTQLNDFEFYKFCEKINNLRLIEENQRKITLSFGGMVI
jgi:hypothetical protein